MSSVIQEATRAALGLGATAPSTVTSYVFNISAGGILVPTFGIDGTVGNDSIVGTSTTNYIFGFAGNDTLSAVTASDGISPAILSGGAGADTFIMGTSAVVALSNILAGSVLDFSASDGDVIDLSGTGLSFSQLVITQTSAASATIRAGGAIFSISGTTGQITLNSSNVLTDGSGADDSTTGSSDSDSIGGSESGDDLRGLDGDDTITGSGGNDTINGNQGNDRILGGDGNDDAQGGQNNDYVNGNGGNDTINGNLGLDTVEGGQGDDVVRGGQGNDDVNGNLGNDSVFGDIGDDIVHGGQGNDSLEGGAGNDAMYGDKGGDTMTGGEGEDTFYFLTVDHGSDVITDFTAGTDDLAFSATLFATSAEVVAAFSNGVIHTDTGSVTLTGVTSLSASDIFII